MSDGSSGDDKMGLNATWSMGVGGMAGGAIFSVLGVVVEAAGSWAWLSFVVAGVIAAAAGYSYVELASRFGEGGGAFTFLREMNDEGLAGSLSWILIVGYVLTMSVYGATFGHYLGHALGLGGWFTRVGALAILGALVLVNLRGVGEAAGVEVVAVWGELLVLLGLAAFGIWHWRPEQLSAGLPAHGPWAAVLGAASIFMSYEGFQLLTYDYEDIRDPKRTLRKGVLLAIGTVIAIYVLVALGSTMILGAQGMVRHKDVALAVAGQRVGGGVGLALVTLAAAFATGSAINATLFATARLAETVSEDGELPAAVDHRNAAGIPDRAVVALGAMAGVLVVIGSLSMLVEAASLSFLFTFGTVSALAFREIEDARRWFPLAGAAGAAIVAVVLVVKLSQTSPAALIALVGITALTLVGRPFVLRHSRLEDSDTGS